MNQPSRPPGRQFDEWRRLRSRIGIAGGLTGTIVAIFVGYSAIRSVVGVARDGRWPAERVLAFVAAAAVAASAVVIWMWRRLGLAAGHLAAAEDALAEARVRQTAEERARSERRRDLQAIARGRVFDIVYQPVFELATRTVVAYEALTRFRGSQRSPDEWFNEAKRLGLGPELEIAAIESALGALGRLPDDTYLAVNLSPETVFSPYLVGLFASIPYALGRISLEITEHSAVEHYDPLVRTLGRLRQMGLRLAVDDVGAGFASFRHVLTLRPDVIKLDRSLTARLDERPELQSLAVAMVRFAADTGAAVCAEGVETAAELDVLGAVGVRFGQGFYLARPAPLDVALRQNATHDDT